MLPKIYISAKTIAVFKGKQEKSGLNNKISLKIKIVVCQKIRHEHLRGLNYINWEITVKSREKR